MTNNNERIYWLAWSQIKGFGPILLKRIQQYFGSLEQAWRSPIIDLRQIEGIGTKLTDIFQEKKRDIEPENLYIEHLKKNPLFLTPIDAEYPPLLLEIPNHPSILYYSGNLNLNAFQSLKPFIAMVGTREPTEHGRKWTYNVSNSLTKHGFTIVSGVAMGIDTIAHRGCLNAGGCTVGVLGNGLDVIYPHSNRKLYEEIQSKGLLLSEYPAGTQPNAKNFPARNRIVAGLCRAILVMEAPEKSGALITARLANEFGRDVYTLPNSPDNTKALGCLRLIHNGADVIISEHELLTMLGAIPNLDPPPPQQLSLLNQLSSPSPSPMPNLSPSFATVFKAIATSPTPFDLIVQESGLSASEVSSILLQLELQDLVSQLPGMHYRR